MTTVPARTRLEQARRALLRIHGALLDEERIRYEREHGRIEGSGTLLQLLIGDPWFAWLRPISTLIVQIDELLDQEQPVRSEMVEPLLAQARLHLRPDEAGDDFQQRYHQLLQEAPAVAVTHAETRALLKDL